MKKQLDQLEAQVREHIRSGSGAVIVDYLNLSIEAAKEELVSAPQNDVAGIQAYIQRTRKQVKRLTCNPAEPQKSGAYCG